MKPLIEKIFHYGLYLPLLTPLIYWQWVMDPLIAPKVFFFQVVVEILLALYLWLAIVDPDYRPAFVKTSAVAKALADRSAGRPAFVKTSAGRPFNSLSWALLVLLAVWFLSGIFGVDFYWSFFSNPQRATGLFWLLHLAAYFLMLWRAPLNWTNYFSASLLVSLVVALFPVIHQIRPEIFFDQVSERLAGTTGNPIFLASYLLLHVFLGAWLVSQYYRQGERLWAGIFAAIALFDLLVLLATQTRGAVVGLAAAALYLIYWAYRTYWSNRTHRIYLSVAVIFLIVFVVFFWTTRTLLPFWQSVPGLLRFTGNLNFGPRLVAWQIALEAFLEKPWLGWGWENFYQAFNKYYNPKMLEYGLGETLFDRPHNAFLEILANSGALGLIAYLVFLYLFYQRLPAPWLKALLVGYLAQNFFNFDTINNYPILFALLAFAASDAAAADRTDWSDKSDRSDQTNLTNQILLIVLLVLFFLPTIFINWPYILGSHRLYWSVNYFLNNLPDEGLFYFHQTLATPSIYRDTNRKELASLLAQMWRQGLVKDKKEVELAISELQKAVSRQPRFYQLRLALADLVNDIPDFGPGYFQMAEREIKELLKISPRRQGTYYVLAKLKASQNDYPAAIAAMEQAINLNPKVATSHFYHALLLFEINQNEAGEKAWQRAESLGWSPVSGEEARVLAGYLGDIGQEEEAVLYFRLALDFNPGDLEGRMKLGLTYYFLGQKELARRHIFEVMKSVDLKQSPQYPEIEPILEDLNLL